MFYDFISLLVNGLELLDVHLLNTGRQAAKVTRECQTKPYVHSHCQRMYDLLMAELGSVKASGYTLAVGLRQGGLESEMPCQPWPELSPGVRGWLGEVCAGKKSGGAAGGRADSCPARHFY